MNPISPSDSKSDDKIERWNMSNLKSINKLGSLSTIQVRFWFGSVLFNLVMTMRIPAINLDCKKLIKTWFDHDLSQNIKLSEFNFYSLPYLLIQQVVVYDQCLKHASFQNDYGFE